MSAFDSKSLAFVVLRTSSLSKLSSVSKRPSSSSVAEGEAALDLCLQLAFDDSAFCTRTRHSQPPPGSDDAHATGRAVSGGTDEAKRSSRYRSRYAFR